MFRSFQRVLLLQLFTICIAATLNAQLPVLDWAIQFGGSNNELIRALDTDANGNIYAVGEFVGTVDFDPGPGTYELTSPNTGGFIVKLDPEGTLVWARSLNGSVNTFAVNDISVDPAGNTWVIGTFAGTMDINPGPGIVTITSSGGSDVFFLRLDPDGNLIRQGRGGGSEDDTGNSIVADQLGNAYMTGRVRQGAVFQSGPNSAGDLVTGFNEPDVFILKLPPTGDFAWYHNVGGFFWDEGNAIALDPEGNVLVTGAMSGPSDFGQSNPLILPGDGSKDIFVYKLSNDGAIIWATAVGPGQEDIARDIAIDAQGDIYTTGTFNGTVDFDPGSEVTSLDAQGGRRAFVQKLTSTGAFAWASMLPSANNNWSSGIHISPSGNVLSTGYFQQTTDFDPGSGTANLPFPSVSPEGHLQQLDANGNYLWAGPFGGAGWDHALAVTTDATGAIFMGGFFEQTADLDPGTGVANFTTTGLRDAFLVKLSAGINTSIAGTPGRGGIRLWPNPSEGNFRIELHGPVRKGTVQVTVFNMLGQREAGPIVFTPNDAGILTIQLERNLVPGIHLVQMEVDGQRWSEQLVVK